MALQIVADGMELDALAEEAGLYLPRTRTTPAPAVTPGISNSTPRSSLRG